MPSQHREGFVLWFTGLPGVGKSTLAQGLSARLKAEGHRTYVLDGDILRTGLSQDLGFSASNRHENIRRAGHVAKILVDAGVIVLAAFITPFADDRKMLRRLFSPKQFSEIFLDCPLEICRQRDPKKLYRKAESGLIPEFTGISSPYEEPTQPDLRIPTHLMSAEQSLQVLWEFIQTHYDGNSG
ncbi:MAG: adenylyl-sulfate kinase [Firmicutes bacterium]|jgi:adenylyl-sulfate kinase|uniref:Adenylyl-sulfate kinase n=1 Tax=Sulfobacillus benefaciens TaxID=453960 RepID=A0A2T2XA23_9FIRM|nr:adenylyl-sulfate kinase [Bacillota bacterium]MCL5015342.1 adenylyl-sulfate kinase [Bacillota bacterium]PSR31340.1 MAG: adenylyl-sulfate kinase [Sulfobacillus benefaciens]HBQ96711.1 adenylyl-sulfate kinase [Sulfobacillus sp.]